MKIGLVQASSGRDISANLEMALRYVKDAARNGCRVLCFPECFLTAYAPEEAESLAVCAGHSALKQIRGMASAYDIDILMGFMEREDTTFHITHGIFRRDESMDLYRKTHLGRRELVFFTPGDCVDVFSLSDGVKIGFQLCVETHYPDITQTLALRGAEVVFAPHAVPRVSGDRHTIWNKYIPARSYDNRIYMACCNLWDEQRFGGGCMVTDPRGETIASCFENAPALLNCEIDLRVPAAFRNREERRSMHFYPALRRRELFE